MKAKCWWSSLQFPVIREKVEEPFSLKKYDFRSFKFCSSGCHCANAVPLWEWMVSRESRDVSGAAFLAQHLPSRKVPAVPMWPGSGRELWPHCCPEKHHRADRSPVLPQGGLTQHKGWDVVKWAYTWSAPCVVAAEFPFLCSGAQELSVQIWQPTACVERSQRGYQTTQL